MLLSVVSRSAAHVRRAQRVHPPAIALPVSDERADAHNGVVGVLGEAERTGYPWSAIFWKELKPINYETKTKKSA
jgi:hypothetical protein